jgi:hypothetical protein
MDSLLNYNAAIQGFSQIKAAEEAKEAGAEKEAEEKTTQFTDPFEQVGVDSLVDLFKQGSKGLGKAALSKLGLTNEKAKQYQEAFRKNGTKGIINQLNEDKNLVKQSLLDKAKSKLPSVPEEGVSGAAKITEQQVEDLLPQEFEKTEGIIKSGLRDRISNLTGDQQKEFTEKIGKRYVKDLDEFGGDKRLANQFNLNQAARTLDEVSGEKPAFSIQSISKSEYSDPIVRDALNSAVKTEANELHPLYRQKYDKLMNERVATPSDISDDVLREKFNLHQANRTLDEIKTLEPKDLVGDAEKARTQLSKVGTTLVKKGETKLVSQLGRVGEDELGQAQKSLTSVFSKTAGSVAQGALGQAGNIAQLATGGINKKNVISIAKNEAISQAQDKAGDLAGELAKAAQVGKEEAKAAAKGVGKAALKEAGEEVGEETAESGEDPIGSAIGLVLGLSTYLGGIFAKHKKPSLPQISNASFQIGA